MLAALAARYRVWRVPPGRQRSNAAERGARAVPGEQDSIRVEVLNASSAVGLARIATWRLREHGIDVVYFGSDTATALDSTQVLVRRGEEAAGERVRRALGLGAVRLAPEPARLVDVTVRLGLDARGTLVRDP